MPEKHIGKVVQVMGPVLDIRFRDGELPALLNAVELENNGKKLIVEVAQHIGDNVVRCIAMAATDGLVRGTDAVDTGEPIKVPVGDECLGRVFNLLGEPVAVQGMQSSAARGFETEDSAVVNVRFADGALASMTISDATASPWNWEATAREDPQYRPFDADAYFIGGTKGALSLPRLHQFSYDGASNWHKPLQMEIPAVDPALPHKMQLKHFVKVVRREVEPVVTPADNVKTLTLLNAIKEAAETGQLVEL